MNVDPFEYLIRRDHFDVPAYQVKEKGYLFMRDYYIYLPDSDTQILTLAPRTIQVVKYGFGDEQGRVVEVLRVFDALVMDTITLFVATITLRNNQLLCVEH